MEDKEEDRMADDGEKVRVSPLASRWFELPSAWPLFLCFFLFVPFFCGLRAAYLILSLCVCACVLVSHAV